MIKPIWAIAGVALLGTAGVAGAIVVASSGGEEEAVQQVDTATPAAAGEQPAPSLTPGPGVTLWRWMNVTLLIPAGSGIEATPDVIYLDDQGAQSRPGISIGKADPDNMEAFSHVLIDAEDGTIFRKQILDQHRLEMELLLATLAVSPFDSVAAPWPYNGNPPADAQREAWFGMSVIRPDPATGVIVETHVGAGGGSGDATPRECEIAVGEGLAVWNGRSTAFVWVDDNTGALCKDLSQVASSDSDSFGRFLSEVKRCGKDVQC